MILDYETLKLIWWLFVGVLLIGFALTDGFDMGVGALLPFVGKNDEERRVVINTVGPHWDGNQVWFITAGGAIFAAWPAVYAAAFSGMYIALLLVLFALFFRPVGFDYRSKLPNLQWRSAWDWGLFAGGVIPATVFGVAFGNLFLGVPFHFDQNLLPHYEGSFFGLLNPFSLLVGVVSLSMLVMHGAVYLQWRTAGVIYERAKTAAQIFAALLIVTFALAGVWLALGIEGYRIVSMPPTDALPTPLGKEAGAGLANYSAYPWMMAAPALGFAGALGAALMARADRPAAAFLSSALSLTGVILTAGFSLFPFVMPSSTHFNSSLTAWDAPSSHLTLTVMFWAAVIFLPIVIAYTVWCYRALWGKFTVEYVRKHDHMAY